MEWERNIPPQGTRVTLKVKNKVKKVFRIAAGYSEVKHIFTPF
jgi:hypothetical protein